MAHSVEMLFRSCILHILSIGRPLILNTDSVIIYCIRGVQFKVKIRIIYMCLPSISRIHISNVYMNGHICDRLAFQNISLCKLLCTSIIILCKYMTRLNYRKLISASWICKLQNMAKPVSEKLAWFVSWPIQLQNLIILSGL